MEEAKVKAQTSEEIAKEILYYPVTNGKADESIQKGVKQIEAYADQFKPKWIDVKERLPESGEWVLCAKPAGIMLNAYEAYMNSKGVILFTNYNYPHGDKNVTHWVELPKAPTI